MKSITIHLSILLALCASCQHEKEELVKQPQSEAKPMMEIFSPDTTKKHAENPGAWLKGASFSQQMTKTELFYFSGNESKDTFKIEIPKGLIANTSAKVSIIDATGKTLYTVMFPTIYLKDGYELLPNPPEGLDSVEQRKFIEDFEQSLTKEFYEKYYTDKFNAFLENAAFDVKKDSYIFDPEYTINMPVRNEILEYPNIRCATFPIHIGEEGTSFIGYSKSKKQAYVFAELD